MAKNRTTIEINGRLYDASTGQIISESPTANSLINDFQSSINISDTKNASAARVINQASQLHTKPQKTKKLHPAAAKAALKKPAAVISKSTPVAQAAQPANVTRLTPRDAVANSRSDRARVDSRSQSVSKFHKQAAETEVAKPKPVAAPTNAIAVPVALPKPEQAKATPAVKATQVIEASEPTHNEQEAATIAKKRPRVLSTSLVVVAVIMAAGIYTYQNIPNMALKIASSRAGIEANLPGYKPSGYKFSGPVSYSEGVIELEFESNSDERKYSILQKQSSWDSKSLLHNYVDSADSDYSTYEAQGITVYVFDENSATWVDGGVWYTITGNALLTTEQLHKIAVSL